MISVDEVYTTVQRLLGKGQQGYLSPIDFNSFAQLANIALFRKMYGSPNKYAQGQPLPAINYASTQYISESLAKFIVPDTALTLTNGIAELPTDLIHTININSTNGIGRVTVKRVEHDRVYQWLNSSIDSPDTEFPIYVELNDELQFYPSTITGVKISYLREPAKPIWAYTLVSGRPSYDAGNSTDFEWDSNEFDWLVYKILQLAGVSIQDQTDITMGGGLIND